MQAAKIIVSVSKGVAQWRKGPNGRRISKKSGDVCIDGWVPANCDLSGKELKLYTSKRDEKPVVIEKAANFFKIVSESKEVSKMFAMISSCMQGIKLEFNQFNRVWERYKHVWEVDREDTITTFVKRKPVLKDFEDELQKYNMARSQLTTEKVEYM